ncbi:hypothetical protein [Ignatzschineria cameli]|uniref:Twin-arginine translocation signal domain-containing protein n=1 Tax=Ignatzschineria cameli TaxID=2182793 RepID=A0A2U2APN9_9GAMM|nr:hypothetical protein [Ignatzschineria cameli]PWD83366.1 hypothetical protein DC080_08745 [Ignatzschineria cameli]PWD85484.1 hypothetical protein DC077_07720 [Ignatzschineria cameli]PWD89202.1 hypothetical protein DC079_07635 [Ignatzschineria cameli]PWD90624.1 hypothetical protein DC081_07060 [Ignatzschineria cameli]PWD91328.1 hypothetical protein DC078_07345 [Ignatzschineria cameli]
MDRKPFHPSRRQFLKISALVAISSMTTPISHALTLTGDRDQDLINPPNRRSISYQGDKIRSLDFDSHYFPLRSYQMETSLLSISPALF